MKQNMKEAIGLSLKRYNETYMKPTNDRIDNIVAQSGTDNTEIVDARIDSAGVTHTTLNNRILAETKMTDEKLTEYSGSSLSVDDTMPGYLQNIEILGNTKQDSENLADIRSVGDKLEGQELYEIPVVSCGKNLFNRFIQESSSSTNYYDSDNNVYTSSTRVGIESFYTYIKVNGSSTYLNFIKEGSVEFAYKYTNSKPTNFADAFASSTIVGTTYAPNTNGYKYLVITFRTLTIGTLAKIKDIMVSEDTQPTPYESYQEDKLTILSPVQLEKVGDVRDRIICKDGVWGVEKNVIDKLFNGSENWVLSGWAPQENTIAFKLQNIKNTNLGICDKFILNRTNSTIDTEAFNVDSVWNEISIRINKSKLSTQDVTGFKKWLSDNTVLVMYSDNTSTFIPLPHDQQVKLRTFASKTNISFLTEIEGTIKTQVPKSIGATVNTHTEQIRSLNNELNRVKKLEESTVSTVTTESDFTTVEATNGGYFEDVKLEGKTLVNLYKCNGTTILNEVNLYAPLDSSYYDLSKNKTLTIINTTNRQFIIDIFNDTSWKRSIIVRNNDYYKIFAIEGDEYIKHIYGQQKDGWGVSQADKELLLNTLILLEGDHTQNPPSYFEGLKSVGQSTSEDGVDEISVESVNENLFDGALTYGYTLDDMGSNVVNSDRFYTDLIEVKYGITYSVPTGCVAFAKYTENKKPLGNSGGSTLTIPYNCKYIRIIGSVGANHDKNIMLTINSQTTEYTPHQSDKKRLLFYNEETQTWEKPVLRKWDSIEKHSNGKYYYHQRSGEVVLNGSENNWNIRTDREGANTQLFTRAVGGDFHTSGNDVNLISDKFIASTSAFDGDKEWFYRTNGSVYVRILKSKLPTQDVVGFKQWLQANNVTVVYQLAEEKVYECTNIDLITYANETNYIVESGAIVPKTTLKVHNNISNVVSLLQKKVSILEGNMTKYMITQNRLMLASRYNADSVSFKVDYSEVYSTENIIDEDLFNLLYNVIIVGKDNYDYDKMLEMMDFYVFEGFISWDMWDYLYEIIDLQHNLPIIEEEIEDSIE